MNKLIIGGVAMIILLGVGWLLLQPSTVGYIAVFDTEVEQLERELQELEILVTSGALTPEEAAAAQRRIIERLDAAATVMVDVERVRLSAAQQAQLTAGLDRLRTTLVTYQGTLQAVDEQVEQLPEAERPTLGRGRTRVVTSANDTLQTVEEFVAEATGEQLDTATELDVVSEPADAVGDMPTDDTEIDVEDEVIELELDAEADAELEVDIANTATAPN